MQRTPTTPNLSVEERRYNLGQDRSAGESEQAKSEKHVGKCGNGPEPGTTDKLTLEAEENLIGFFRLLFEIDRRINPQLYGRPIRDTKCRDEEEGHVE